MTLQPTAAQADLLTALARLGVASSAQLQAALGKSQPTLSRTLRELAGRVVVLGQQRSARYALLHDLLGLPGQQPLWWTDADGAHHEWGQINHLGQERLHVQAPGVDVLTQGRLPWFLQPLRLQGFLGRLWARSPQAQGYDSNPERWRIDQLLALLLREVHDLPGAISLGPEFGDAISLAPADLAARRAHHDAQADALIHARPVGSSAGGEQAKFIARDADGSGHLIVKYTPPRGTPFGERWHDLLHAEALALQVLGEHGVPVAGTRVLQSARRTYLESTRFDRVGAKGRRHVVALDAVHEAFVPGPRQHWDHTCAALARQRRLPASTADQVRALRQFGRLIGNNDMHFGNLSLLVARPEDIAAGRFQLAPVYDMLPMRWRPDPQTGDTWLTPFEPELADLAGPARPVALAFWQCAEAHSPLSRPFRALAATMTQRLK